MLIPNKKELEEILWGLYCEKLENECLDFIEDTEGVGFVKREYWLTPDDQAQELGFRDFADFSKDYLQENFEVIQPDWVTNWARSMGGAR